MNIQIINNNLNSYKLNKDTSSYFKNSATISNKISNSETQIVVRMAA